MADGRHAAVKVQATPKLPPYSLEAEQNVLGGLMLNNRAFEDVAAIVSESDFYRPDHQLIWRSLNALGSCGKPMDLTTLANGLQRAGLLEEAGGMAYIGTLANDTPSASNVRAYAEIVRERSILRSLIQVAGEIADAAFRPDGRGWADLVDLAEQRVMGLRQSTQRNEREVLDQPALVDRLNAKLEKLRANVGELPGLSTGLHEFDQLTMGLHPADLVIVAGRPSMGKTAFSMGVVEHVVMHQRKAAAVFSMEMPADHLQMRVVSSFGRIDMAKLRSGELNDREWDRYTSISGQLREAPLYIDESGALTPQLLRAKARRLKLKHDVALIVVDYVQLMQCPGNENRTNEVAEISRNLKALAKELNIPIVALSQLSRSVEQRENKRPRMADLRESGGIEQDADVVACIYRDEVYHKESKDAGTAEIIIVKQRNGPLGTARTAFLGQYTRFENLAPDFLREQGSVPANQPAPTAPPTAPLQYHD